MKNGLKRLLALAVAGGLLVSAFVVGVVAPANAHTGDLTVTAVCDPVTGTYKVKADLTLSRSDLSSVTTHDIGRVGDGFRGTPQSAGANWYGPLNANGPGTYTIAEFTLGGASKGELWIYAYTRWSDNFGQGSDGSVIVDGTCALPPVQPLPKDKGIDCTTAWFTTGAQLKNGDHININIGQGGQTFQRNVYVDRNLGGFDTLGLRITPGNLTRPLTENEVLTGRFSHNFGSDLTGQYTVQWAQFNDTYFNQPDNPDDYIHCGTPPVPEKPADKVTVTTTDNTWDCDATEVTQTVTTTTIGTTLIDNVWVESEPVVVTTSTTRPFTPEEIQETDEFCAGPGPEEPSTETGSWVDTGTYTCGDTTVTQTRTITTIPYKLVGRSWDLDMDNAVVTYETSERILTAEEREQADIACAGEPDIREPIIGAWVVGEYSCGDTEVELTRQTTTFFYDRVGAEWVETAADSYETDTRPLTEGEISELDCPVIPEEPEEPVYTPGEEDGAGTPILLNTQMRILPTETHTLAKTGTAVSPITIGGGILFLLLGGAALAFAMRRRRS